MRKCIPLKALVQEATKLLENTGHPEEEDRTWHFTFSVGWNNIEILAVNGSEQVGCDNNTIYRHFVEINPRKRVAFFYEYCGLPEVRGLIEKNLLDRKYAIKERDLMWFNLGGKEKGFYEKNNYPSQLQN